MATTTNLGLTTYVSSGTTSISWPTYVDSLTSNFDKIDAGLIKVDDTLSVSGEAADAKATGDAFSKYMLISDYDPQGKAEDIFKAISSASGGNAVLYGLKIVTESWNGSPTITITNNTQGKSFSYTWEMAATTNTLIVPFTSQIDNMFDGETGDSITVVVSKEETSGEYKSPTTYTLNFSLNPTAGRKGYLSYTIYYNPTALATSTLEDNAWADIHTVASNGLATNYWSVGDTHSVVLNGSVRSTSNTTYVTYSNFTAYAFILGFDHNSTYEGSNKIHFCLGMVKSGTSFINAAFGPAYMHFSSTAVGWKSSDMFYYLLSGDSTSAYSNSFMAALPSDLRSAMTYVTKYTHNVATTGSSASYVTANTEYLSLPSEYEAWGSSRYADTNEQTYQKRYDYWTNNNSQAPSYVYNSTSTSCYWWLRSPNKSSMTAYCCNDKSSTVSGAYSSQSVTRADTYIRPIFFL